MCPRALSAMIARGTYLFLWCRHHVVEWRRLAQLVMAQIDPCDRKPFGPLFDSRLVQGNTWKGASPRALAEIRELLIRRGAVEDKDLRNPHEAWRGRVE